MSKELLKQINEICEVQEIEDETNKKKQFYLNIALFVTGIGLMYISNVF